MTEEATLASLAEIAVRLAADNTDDGQLPCGAVVARQGTVLATGVNTTLRDNDPTAHAEVAAVRAACRALGTTSLAGAIVVSSCEPCPMCHIAAVSAAIGQLVFVAPAAMAAEYGFASSAAMTAIRDRLEVARRADLLQHPMPGAAEPFRRYGARRSERAE